MPRLCALVFLSLALTTGCDGTAEDGSQPDYCDGSFSARIDGEAFEANTCDVGDFLGSLSLSGGKREYRENGVRNLGSVSLQISPIPSQGTTGTFPVTGICTTRPGVCASYDVDAGLGADGNYDAPDDAGTVRITTFTANRIAGTFAFEALNDDGGRVEVTDGQFDLPITP